MSKLKTTVEEFTSPSPISATSTQTLFEIKGLMDENGIRHVPIIEDDKLVGIISQRDLKVALMIDSSNPLTAKDIMVRDVATVSVNTSLEEAAFEMSEKKIGSLVVEEDSGKVYGIFTSTDALNALIEVARGSVD